MAQRKKSGSAPKSPPAKRTPKSGGAARRPKQQQPRMTKEEAMQKKMRELELIKVKAETRDAREDIIQITNVFRGNIVDFGQSTLIIAVVGAAEKIKAILKLLDDYGILETARTGMVALERGQKTIYDQNKLKEEYNYGKNVL